MPDLLPTSGSTKLHVKHTTNEIRLTAASASAPGAKSAAENAGSSDPPSTVGSTCTCPTRAWGMSVPRGRGAAQVDSRPSRPRETERQQPEQPAYHDLCARHSVLIARADCPGLETRDGTDLRSNGVVDRRYIVIKNPLETQLYSLSVVWVKQLHVFVEVVTDHLTKRFFRRIGFYWIYSAKQLRFSPFPPASR